jgi:hypothetical protein
LCLLLSLLDGRLVHAATSFGRSEALAPWHDCARNEEAIQCRREETEPGVGMPCGFVVLWRDGAMNRLKCRAPCEPYGHLTDERGGVWKHEFFIQGNSTYIQFGTGESIFIPLRPPRT